MTTAIATDNNGPSSCASPDLDWSQVRETVMMLNVAVAQIEGSMRDGDDSVRALTDSFTFMASVLHTISSLAMQLDVDGGDADLKEQIQDNCKAVTGMVQGSIVAFQFYDKLTQRLSHVSNSMNSLSSLVSEPSKVYNPAEWSQVQHTILSQYSTEVEYTIAEAIHSGKSVREAIESVRASEPETPEGEEDIELF